jgi:hypothetical protein
VGLIRSQLHVLPAFFNLLALLDPRSCCTSWAIKIAGRHALSESQQHTSSIFNIDGMCFIKKELQSATEIEMHPHPNAQ